MLPKSEQPHLGKNLFEPMIWLISKNIIERYCKLSSFFFHFYLQDFNVSAQPKQIELYYVPVPRCLLLTLECVEIKELIMGEEIGKKLVRYFLENSKVLKKLILRFKGSPTTNQVSDISKELLTFTKASRKCQIIIH